MNRVVLPKTSGNVPVRPDCCHSTLEFVGASHRIDGRPRVVVVSKESDMASEPRPNPSGREPWTISYDVPSKKVTVHFRGTTVILDGEYDDREAARRAGEDFLRKQGLKL
jgi:hypothetical protein